MTKPVVAVVGRPNVGKSTFVNRVSQRPEAIVHETEGVTRDRTFHDSDWNGTEFSLCDTGGIEVGDSEDAFQSKIRDQAVLAINEADAIIFLVDGKTGVTDEQIEAACKLVGLDHYIKTLPKGCDTELNDRSSLSAGQRQLLTIARAMVENAPMIILDEATSSVDTRTEVLVQKAMDRLTRGRTSFVIAHRLSTIRDADLILVMDKGDIVESGTHEQLLEKGGLYKELYTSQFENK